MKSWAQDLVCEICLRAGCNELHMAEPDPEPEQKPEVDGVVLEDFRAYMPMHQYIFVPSRELWPASSVNARLSPVEVVGDDGKDKTIAASTWLDQNRAVEQMTWSPGLPTIVRDRLIAEGGWIERPDCNVFNLYRPPTIEPGDPTKAEPWLEHVHMVFPEEADHIIRWLAQRVQRPDQKINHALVLGGAQGIGKDTTLEPVKAAVGPWNFCDISPAHLLGRFNGFAQSVILRVSEARDLGDVDRFAFYDHTKVYTAAPPDVLRVDQKNMREYAITNVCGVVITTNHLGDGIYLPPDDRRHFVAWSSLTRDDFPERYWRDLYAWLDRDGTRHVAAYLASLDLAGFDPKAPPPKTSAWQEIVDANRAPEDDDLVDALERLGNPTATTLSEIANATNADDFAAWLKDRRNSRVIPHRLGEVGYVAVRCPTTTDGRWKIAGRNQVVYARRDLPIRDRIVGARELAESSR